MGPCRLPGLLQCERCGFVSANLSLTDAEIAKLYGHDYFHGDEYLDYVAEEESLRLNFDARLRTLQRVIADLRDRDIFEIGCAYGFFLDEARRFANSVAGIDISEDAAAYGRQRFGLDIRQGDYLNLALGKSYDVIAMWDTVEHLQRPDLFVAKIKGDLKPGGVLALTTGDIGSLNARLRGKNWRMIHPPTHLHYFSAATMRALLDRAGFDVVHLSHPGIVRNLRSILYYVLVWRTRKTGLYDALSRLPVFDLRINVNMFDIMYVIARRR
jgi:2-polyprenyl-3-methyl-5-hydroxy-6-metoxy-1,4-benzoquinol methylase